MNIDGIPHRSIRDIDDGRAIQIIDQTRLPWECVQVRVDSYQGAARAIADMRVRGAPLIGVTAAWGMALAMGSDPSDGQLGRAYDLLLATRPTAVNLRWALDRVVESIRPLLIHERAQAAITLATQMADQDVATNSAIGDYGLALLCSKWGQKSRINILTHCNAGWLATVDWGTALAPIYKAHDAGIAVHVFVDETRPRNQGASLTAWELRAHGVPHTVIADNAGGHLMQQGLIDLCLVGCDRATPNGDICNKIGTYLKALAAHDNHVPFYAALPTSTFDPAASTAEQIPIEHRSDDEIRFVSGVDDQYRPIRARILADTTPVANPGFDITPARLITGIITENGIV